MKYIFTFFLIFVLREIPLCSGNVQEEEPRFAGTLLSFYPRNTPPGRITFQPFLFVTRQSGIYDSKWAAKPDRNIHQYEELISIETGITNNIDIDLVFNTIYVRSGGKEVFSYGDTKVFFGFQISTDKRGAIVPDFRVILGESFPTGEYKNLSPDLKGGDASGLGSYQTFLIFVLRKIFYTQQDNSYNWNLNLYYTHASKADVEGFSVYGGLADTRGVVTPGNAIIINLAYEYKFNLLWGVGIDFRYAHQNSASFHRKNGSTSFAGLPSLERASMAPCIEYNINENLNMIGGVWFSVAGRNDVAFKSGILTLHWEF